MLAESAQYLSSDCRSWPLIGWHDDVSTLSLFSVCVCWFGEEAFVLVSVCFVVEGCARVSSDLDTRTAHMQNTPTQNTTNNPTTNTPSQPNTKSTTHQRARLVRAQDVHAGHLLDGAHARDNGAVLGELPRAERERDRQHGRHRDGDAADDDDEDVGHGRAHLEADVALVRVVHKLHDQLDRHPHGDGDEADGADARHDLLDVGDVVGGADERGGAAEEGVDARRVHDRLALALLDGRARKRDVASELLRRQRLARQRGLVDLHRLLLLVVLVAHQLQVGGHDVAKLDDEDVAGHDVDRVHRLDLAIAERLVLLVFEGFCCCCCCCLLLIFSVCALALSKKTTKTTTTTTTTQTPKTALPTLHFGASAPASALIALSALLSSTNEIVALSSSSAPMSAKSA